MYGPAERRRLGRAVLVLGTMLSSWRGCRSATSDDSSTGNPFEVNVCILLSAVGGLSTATGTGVIPELMRAVEAVRDVNRQSCTAMRHNTTDCARLLDVGGGEHVMLRLLGVWELHGADGGDAAASAVEECNAEGGMSIVGPTNGEQAVAASWIARPLGMPVLGYSSVVPMLPPDQTGYHGYIRMGLSDEQRAISLVHFIHAMGWQRAVVIHGRDAFGHGMAGALQSQSAELGVHLTSFSVSTTREGIESAAVRLGREFKERVVVLAVTEQSVLDLLLAYDAVPGMTVGERVWISGWPYLEDVLAAVQTLPDEQQGDGHRVLRGLIAAASHRPLPLDDLQGSTDGTASMKGSAIRPSPSILRTRNDEGGGGGDASPGQRPRVRSAASAAYYAEQMYDSIWATALGWAAAGRADNVSVPSWDGTPPSAASVVAHLIHGDELLLGSSGGSGGWFDMAAGNPASWDARGELNSSSLTVDLYNYQQQRQSLEDDVWESGSGVVNVVGSWSAHSGLTKPVYIEWPDGNAFPQVVPSEMMADAREEDAQLGDEEKLRIALIVSAVLCALLLLVVVLLLALRLRHKGKSGVSWRRQLLADDNDSDARIGCLEAVKRAIVGWLYRCEGDEMAAPMLSFRGAGGRLSTSQSAPSADNVEIVRFLSRFDEGPTHSPSPKSPKTKGFGFIDERDDDGGGDTPSARGQLATLPHKDAMGPEVVQYLLGICDPDDAIARRASVDLVGAAARARRSLDMPDLVVPHRPPSSKSAGAASMPDVDEEADDDDDDDDCDGDCSPPQRMPLYHQANTPAPSRTRFRSTGLMQIEEHSVSSQHGTAAAGAAVDGHDGGEVEGDDGDDEEGNDSNSLERSSPLNTAAPNAGGVAMPDIFAAALPTTTMTRSGSPGGEGAALPGAVPRGNANPARPKRFDVSRSGRLLDMPAKHVDDVEVPRELAERVATDFRLDTITGNSPLEGCHSPLATVMRQCVTWFKLKERLLISQKNVRRLMAYSRRLEEGYEGGGYHCKRHAADVTHRFATILHRTGYTDVVGPYEVLAALVAAALHDYKHPQLTNNFLILQESEIAESYNYQSPGENHSLYCALSMLKNSEELNFLEDVWRQNSVQHRQKFRHNIAEIVLATDMKKHFAVLKQFRMDIARNEHLSAVRSVETDSAELWAAMDDPQRLLCLQVALKVADVGHCTLPMEQHTAWLERLEDEMFKQGDEERRYGLPISPLMDRNRTGVNAAKSQVGFFDVIVLPLLSEFVGVFPECQPMLDQAEANRKYWAKVAKLERGSMDGRPSMTASARAIPSHCIFSISSDSIPDASQTDDAANAGGAQPQKKKSRVSIYRRSMSMRMPSRSTPSTDVELIDASAADNVRRYSNHLSRHVPPPPRHSTATSERLSAREVELSGLSK